MGVTKSLTSRGYLKDTFNWQWHYCFLTNEGIDYLREVLHLPSHVAPQTLTKQRAVRPLATAAGQGGDSYGDRKGGKGGQGGQGRWTSGNGKGWGKGGPDGDYKPQEN